MQQKGPYDGKDTASAFEEVYLGGFRREGQIWLLGSTHIVADTYQTGPENKQSPEAIQLLFVLSRPSAQFGPLALW